MDHLILDRHWRLKQRNTAVDLAADLAADEGWLPATVPGTVHEALRAADRIPDPFYGRNEHDVQWVGECGWLYRCDFDVSAELLAAADVTLELDGLDTIATVCLNGVEILASDNMFVPHRVAVGEHLRQGANELAIVFEPALLHGRHLEADYGARRVWNGDPSRVYVRKAQYHYGWDWGPCLLTAGPWLPIRLVAGPRIADVRCDTTVADDFGHAEIAVKVELTAASDSTLRVELHGPDGAALQSVDLPGGSASHTFQVDAPALWWPSGYGAQPLYRVVVTLLVGGAETDRQERRVGLRRLRLVQEPLQDEPGTTFLFEVNGTPLFAGGANWIPSDLPTTRLTTDDYRVQLEQAAAANMVMLRIWGGGIYEVDAFYDICDELGLLVWQDFMFACGIYPAHPEFQASVRAEAEAQVRRLRHHPSIAIWCGNNEDYQIAGSLGLYDRAFDGDFTQTGFPARELYERLLPAVCAELDPSRPYWPGSAWGGDQNGSDPTVGDRHTWDVWHGAMAPYADYPKYEGRFVSEFGMEAAPSLTVLESVVPEPERYAQSRTVEHHNKSEGGARRLAVYLNDTLRVPDTLADYVYATQFVQAEALAAAYHGWRRRWGGPGRYAVAGALVWQLDDCWPVISWAIVDYAREPKPAYYVIRRALAPLALGLAPTAEGAAIWAVTSRTAPVEAELQLQLCALDGTELDARTRGVTLAANAATELGAIAIAQPESTVVAARLVVAGQVVARATLWPQPFKYLALPDPEVSVRPLGDGRFEVAARRPAKGVWLQAPGARWDDNMLDLVPGDPQVVTAPGVDAAAIQVRWLRSET